MDDGKRTCLDVNVGVVSINRTFNLRERMGENEQ